MQRKSLGGIFFSGLIAAVLFAATPGWASDSDHFVIVCSYGHGSHSIMTFDLAARTLHDEWIQPNPGGSPDPIHISHNRMLSEVSDAKITWHTDTGTLNGVKGDVLSTLDRYTGDLTSTVTNWPNYRPRHFQCHKQERQF